MKKIIFVCAPLLTLTAQAQVYHHAQAELVHEFTGTMITHTLYPIGDKLIYLRAVSSDMVELWSTDGTQAGTVKITDTLATLDNQLGSFAFKGLANIGKNYYLAPGIRTSQQNLNDAEPFITDGTIAGSFVLADLNPNTSGQIRKSSPRSFTSFDNSVIFCATVGSYENLYSHDGVSAPLKLKDNFYFGENIIYDNELYLVSSLQNGKTGLFKMADALSAPVLIDEFTSISNLQILGNLLIFTAEKNAQDNIGEELYAFDKSSGNTSLVTDIVAGQGRPVWSNSSQRITLTGRESIFVVKNNIAYFQIQNPNNSLYYVYRTDGSSSGTYPIFRSASYIEPPHAAKDNIIFYAQDSASGKSGLITTDGSSKPMLLKNGGAHFYPVTNVSISGKYTFKKNGEFVCSGKASGLQGSGQSIHSLIISDGTDAGTKLVKIDFPPNQFGAVDMSLSGYYSIIDDYLYFLSGSSLFRINLNAISATSIESLAAPENKLKLFPNPLENETLNIKTSGNWDGTADLLVYDIRSSCILKTRINLTHGEGKIRMQSVPKGAYFMILKKNGISQNGKFIIR